MGARLVLLAPSDHLDSDKMLDVITRHRVSLVEFIPSMMDALDPLFRFLKELCNIVLSGEALLQGTAS